MLLQDSRRDARVDADGRLVLLPDQDRSRWDRAAIAEGMTLVARAWRLGREGKYLLQATIAAEHARGETSDWGNIAYLYDRLLAVSPTPIVALNRAVAVAELRGPEAGLALMAELDEELGELPPAALLARRAAAPPRPHRRGARGLPRGAGPRRQPGRARVPRGLPSLNGGVPVDVGAVLGDESPTRARRA